MGHQQRKRRKRKPLASVMRPLDPSDPRSPEHPCRQEQWHEFARAFGRAFGDVLADVLLKIEQEQKIKIKIDQISDECLQRLFVAWLGGGRS